jgi:hypothetical protein
MFAGKRRCSTLSGTNVNGTPVTLATDIAAGRDGKPKFRRSCPVVNPVHDRVNLSKIEGDMFKRSRFRISVVGPGVLASCH